MRFILKVTHQFNDKYTGKLHQVGDTLALDDEARTRDITRKNLGVLISAKPKAIVKKHGK